MFSGNVTASGGQSIHDTWIGPHSFRAKARPVSTVLSESTCTRKAEQCNVKTYSVFGLKFWNERPVISMVIDVFLL